MRFADLSHQEATCGWRRPGHPLVCIIDAIALTITIVLLALYPQTWAVRVLPVTIAALYTVSIAYHWLPNKMWLRRLDHLMIANVIAATSVSFWASELPLNESAGRFAGLAALLAIVYFFKLCLFSWQITGGVLFFALGVYGVAISLYEYPLWLPPLGLGCYWVGLVLYTAQMLVYSCKKPDFVPCLFGFREFQHVPLACATTLHAWALLAYL